MKKAIVLIILFCILATTFTATMINIKNIEKQNSTTLPATEIYNNDDATPKSKPSETHSQKVDNTPKEKTVDLYATFNENDLKIEEKLIKDISNFSKINVLDEESYLPQISGLKNKEVEEKINKDIVKRTEEALEKLYADKPDITIMQTLFSNFYSECANFANVISVALDIYYKKDEINYTKYIGLNYELISGNRLRIEDIFIKDFAKEDIIRLCLNRQMAKDNMNSMEEEYYDEKPFFNNELNCWQFIRKYEYYDENKEEWITRRETLDYVPAYDEYEVEKIIKRGIDEDNFYFSPVLIYLTIKDSYNYYEYLENGEKEYVNENGTFDYYIKDIADKVVIYDKFLTEESLYENENIGRKNIITCSQEIYSPYEKQSIFKSNNYFYDFLPFLNDYTVGSGYYGEKGFNYSEKLINNVNNKMNEIIDYYDKEASKNKNKAYFLFVFPYEGNDPYNQKLCGDYNDIIYFKSKLIVCDINEKKMIEDQLFEEMYRYYNIGFYGSVLYEAIYSESFPIYNDSITYDEKYYYYNINTGEFLFEDTERMIEKMEYNYMSKELLNKEYNKIFARHGHDFQSEELKEYFNNYYWYNPIPGKVVTMSELSQVEAQNANLLKQLIEEKS